MSLDTKLVIVLSSALTGAEAVNTAAAAHTSDLGAKAVDGDGRGYGALDRHPIPLLAAAPSDLAILHHKAEADLTRLADTRSPDVAYTGLAICGPRHTVTAATKRLALSGAAS